MFIHKEISLKISFQSKCTQIIILGTAEKLPTHLNANNAKDEWEQSKLFAKKFKIISFN